MVTAKPAMSRSKKVTFVAGATALFGASIAGTCLIANSMTGHVTSTPIVASPTPSVLSAINTNAQKSVDALIATLPSSSNGASKNQSTNGIIQDFSSCMAPVYSVVQPYSGGSWLHPKGFSVMIAAYQAGMGHNASACIAKNADMIESFGDVVVAVKGETDLSETQIKSLATKSIVGCADETMESTDLSSRNPNSQSFTGLIKTETVHYDGADPQRVQSLVVKDITLPDVPTTPHNPQALPAAPAKPVNVTAPAYPTLSRPSSYVVNDPIGPGCGWSFTGMTQSVQLTQAQLDANRSKANSAVQAAEHKDVAAYMKALAMYQTAAKDFNTKNVTWTAYGKTVSDIAAKWAFQKITWNQYLVQLDAYNQAESDYNTFIQNQKDAQSQFDQQTALCHQMVTATLPATTSTATNWTTPAPTVTQVTTYPAASGSATPVPHVETSTIQPAPVPHTTTNVVPGAVVTTPAAMCPERPAILDEAPPTVPAKPTAPTF